MLYCNKKKNPAVATELNGKSKNGHFSKQGKTVTANFKGVSGASLGSIPEGFRPSEDASCTFLDVSSGGQIFLGYLNFNKNGTIEAFAFGAYAQSVNAATNCANSGHFIYGTASWTVD